MNEQKSARLQRMQRLNLALLFTTLLLLAFSVRYQAFWPGLRWLQAFAEASAIGAIADWYAVVALFRRPLSLPVPHTAIIARKQQDIGNSLGRFVSQYLLTPQTIGARLERLGGARRMIDWLTVPDNAQAFAASLTNLLPAILRAPDDADLRRLVRNTVLPHLARVDAAGLVAKFTSLLLETNLHSTLLDRALGPIDGWLTENEALLREKFGAASRYTPAFVDTYIVRKFLDGVRALIHDVGADPAHPLRDTLERALHDWVGQLRESPRQREAAQQWLHAALDAVARDQNLQQLREALALRIERDLARTDSALRQSTAAIVLALAEGIAREPSILQRLEAAWLRWVREQAGRHGDQIATLIAEVVGGWNPQEVVRRVELEIGPDLQFIRINGALVGGLVGVLLYAGTVALGR
jgi:uncharacterized membrane-anchored protein YjiN (DUF445 family)